MKRVSIAVALLAALPPAATAQERTPVEEIVVTGSRLRRDPAASPSPLTIVGAADFSAAGYTAASDVVRFLPVNTGPEFNLDPFTQNLSGGTSSLNLRGLGLNATLVLLNGRRQTASGGIADDGSSFVDLNALMPLIMLDRLEILKDGAAALYGTDAVAGVANFITRDGFEGAEIQADYADTARSSQYDLTVAGIAGAGGDRWHLTAAVSYLHRSWLTSTERDFTAGKAFSSFGQPGSFILLAPSPTFPNLPFGLANPQPIIDPDCGVTGGTPSPRPVQPPGMGNFRVGSCIFDFAPYYHLVGRERRWNAYGTERVDLTDTVTAFAEAGFARNTAYRGTSPSFPLLNLPLVPPNNPGNVFAAPALFTGRALGASAGSDYVDHSSETWRAVGGLRSDPSAPWSWEGSASYSSNDFFVGINDALNDRFNAAIAGRGGPGNNAFFNPFGSAARSQPGTATFNDPAVIADFIDTNTYDYTASLLALDASLSGAVLALPAGELEIAAGGQYRRERFVGRQNDQYNRENYLFFIGGPDFAGRNQVWAGFAEARVPLAAGLEAQLALRHESYGGGLSSTDPKVALLWRPHDWIAVRASYSTSFRAPSAFQRFSVQTVLSNITDPATQSTAFRGVRTVGSTALAPEQAKVANVGATISPLPSLRLSGDYWRFDYTDILIKESAQGLLNANPFDPRVFRQAGQIVRIDTSYINASAARTDGFDVTAAYALSGAFGDLTAAGEATYINSFEIEEGPGRPPRDVVGNRNFLSFARSLPRWRTNLSLGWELGRHSAHAILRSIARYRDDQNANALIRAHTTLDLQYGFRVPGFWGDVDGPQLTVGAINLFDRDPPAVNTNAGYDSKVHDPRGRVLYLRIKQSF